MIYDRMQEQMTILRRANLLGTQLERLTLAGEGESKGQSGPLLVSEVWTRWLTNSAELLRYQTWMLCQMSSDSPCLGWMSYEAIQD